MVKMITKTEAISFLREHQPMPGDEGLKKDEIEKYEEVRKYFLNNPDEQCIPLFLHSFGGKDGFGVYQMVEDVIAMYDKEVVLPHILEAFTHSSESVKYWCIQISSNFPDHVLFHPLVRLLQTEDEDMKEAAITALAQLALNSICRDEVITVLKDELERMPDEGIRGFAAEVLADIQNSFTEETVPESLP